MKIEVYNQSVKLQSRDTILLYHLENFIDKFYTVKQKSFSYGNKDDIKKFISKIETSNEYVIHIYQFLHFKKYLESINYKTEDIEVEDKRDYKVELANMSVRENWQPRDYQIEVIDFLTTNIGKSKLVSLQTGKGKTFIALYSLAKINQRTAIVILPTYIDKWVQDIVSVHNVNYKDVLVVQGSKSLKYLIELAKDNNVEYDYIIFSSRTLQDFINSYEKNKEETIELYGCSPLELFPLLNIGIMLIDETHQHFHAIFKIVIHSNVKYLIGLSATLLSDNYVIRKLHSVVYPKNNIYEDNNYDRYTDMYAISYSIGPNHLRLIKTENRGSDKYSHIAFEQSILKHSFLLNKYIDLINELIEDYYIEEYQAKDKLLIFVSTVNLATILTEKISEKFKHLVVKRYCEDDPYDHIKDADIIVSTLISAGTALDINNLRVVIQTISISSSVANIQSFGRLRKLNDRDTKFCYLYCSNISKHVKYHLKRLELFKNKAKKILERRAKTGL